MESFFHSINVFIWGIPVLFMILATGIHLSIRSRLAQVRFLPAAMKHFVRSLSVSENDKESFSGYRALCTALAATVGTGNIAGVAGAIAVGGPGVIFWMWICAILGMITKFAEVSLAVYFRNREEGLGYIGGPMYIIQNGLSEKYHCLAVFYCIFGILASFGIGNAVQVNTVMDGISAITQMFCIEFRVKHKLFLGAGIAILVFVIFKNGASGIGRIAERLVPVASGIYILLALLVICLRFDKIPAVLTNIITGAFTPNAVTGGVLCSAFITLRVGVSRGVFTNEAGMGTASIAHASTDVTSPIEQGFMGIIEVFLDTIVICSLTAFVILSSGITIPYGSDLGITLSLNAFSMVLGDWSKVLLTVLTCIFAFATILGWGLYGGRCCQFLFGANTWNAFVYGQSAAVILGAVLNTSLIWSITEIMNGLMAIPNLIGISAVSGVFIHLLEAYRSQNHKVLQR